MLCMHVFSTFSWIHFLFTVICCFSDILKLLICTDSQQIHNLWHTNYVCLTQLLNGGQNIRSVGGANIIQMSNRDPKSTTLGYMPIILSPAHEYDTLNTVIIRCKHIAQSLGQPQAYVVLTADEALLCRLMELKWSQNHTYLFPRLGSLHSSMNFMKVIGQHFDSCGLLEVWTESGLLGGKTAQSVLAGKDYEKGMRAHKITFQAISACLLPQLLSYLEEHNKDLKHQIQVADSEGDDLELMTVLVNPAFQKAMHSFITQQGHNPNFAFWFTYLELVSILLLFTRASRGGLWELHLSTFKRMLPYFCRYDHINYAKRGTVYLAEMNMLPQQVLSESGRETLLSK